MGDEEQGRVVAKLVRSVLGRSNSDACDVVLRAISKNYDRHKLKSRLSDCVKDASLVSKLSDRVLEDLMVTSSRKRSKKFEEFPSHQNGDSKKRRHRSPDGEKKPKIKKEEPEDVKPSIAATDALKIKELMAQASKAIEEKKRKMNLTNINPGMGVSSGFSSKLAPTEAGRYMEEAMEKAKRAAQLKDKISAKLPAVLAAKLADASAGGGQLKLDKDGRALDSDGNPLLLAQRQPTLKANIRQEKRDLFLKAQQETSQLPLAGVAKDKSGRYAEDTPSYLDPRLDIKGPTRGRRQFSFHEKGEFEQLANRQRAKAKLEKLQTEISQASKKTGISSAVKLAVVGPKAAEAAENDVPDVEWWDRVLLPDNNDSYECIDDDWATDLSHVITPLVEHPIQLRAPTDPFQPQAIKVHLTKKERKKLRRQTRKETQREKNEKMRLGLEKPPEPKMKISNLMRVLGSDAVQDPTKMEAHVRKQMAQRLRKHEEANAARKLTPEQRTAKKIKKLQEDTAAGVNVTVYRVKDLSNLSKKFKVEMNAKQLHLTGNVILHKDMNVVIVEGGPKGQKKFNQLMTHRIKWEEDKITLPDGTTEDNACIVVWEGIAKKRAFGEMKFKSCPLEKQAREYLAKHAVAHYWDMTFTGSILEQEAPS